MNREISSTEVTELFIERIRAKDPALKSFITLSEAQAIEQAKQADEMISRGEYKGPLHGIPFAVKDIFLTKGIRTTYGSKIFADFVPTEDATVISRLKNSGAILIGKNNLHEFAGGATNDNPHYGTCRNPWDQSRIPGDPVVDPLLLSPPLFV